MLRPIQSVIVCNDHQAFAGIAGGLEAALHEYLDALSRVAGTPRRVRIEAIELANHLRRKRVCAVVQARLKVSHAFVISDSRNRTANALVEVEHRDMRRTVVKYASRL